MVDLFQPLSRSQSVHALNLNIISLRQSLVLPHKYVYSATSTAMPLIRCFTTDGHYHLPFVEGVQRRRNIINRAHIARIHHSVGSYLLPFSAAIDMTLVPLFILSS